ncbi:MAG TPA: amidohydrolase [Verrucomicrobiae bacterium]|nr:amidohydrolase [Verrucomicrobiae bacterium]
MRSAPAFAHRRQAGSSRRIGCWTLIAAALLAADARREVQAGASNDLRATVVSRVNQEYPGLFDLYKHLHAHPELSFKEEQTAGRVAGELRSLGFDVTVKVGGHGLVGVLKNGSGPAVLVRTDLDALPVKEQTDLPYASKVTAVDEHGQEVEVMHACGHDVHMTVFVGVARLLARLQDHWKGTLVMIGQPAEERGAGARAMIKDGLFTRFPKPDYCLALHVKPDLPAGSVGWVEGYALGNVDSVDVTIRGVGGHGAWPHRTKDPVVLAAETVLALQTIVSREIAPGEPAVVTVGSIHGGAKHNIIPDEVKLQLTLRSYTDEVRQQTIAAVNRITRGLAQAAGIPEDRLPVVTVRDEFTPATYNDPPLTRRVAAALKAWLGDGNVVAAKPVMGGEDFSEYGRTKDKIPICLFWLGAITAESVRESLRTGKSLPSLHSSQFAPDPEPTIKTGVTAMTATVLDLMGKP